MKRINTFVIAVVILLSAIIVGCANRIKMNDEFDEEYNRVKIFSTTDLNMAQKKADILCGHHAYYQKKEHEMYLHEKNSYPEIMANTIIAIPYDCDVFNAARGGNPEAQILADKERAKLYKQLDEAKQHQYEVHQNYAKKHGGDSYSIVNPDGSIEAHSFGTDGSACHSIATPNGAETYCN